MKMISIMMLCLALFPSCYREDIGGVAATKYLLKYINIQTAGASGGATNNLAIHRIDEDGSNIEQLYLTASAENLHTPMNKTFVLSNTIEIGGYFAFVNSGSSGSLSLTLSFFDYNYKLIDSFVVSESSGTAEIARYDFATPADVYYRFHYTGSKIVYDKLTCNP